MFKIFLSHFLRISHFVRNDPEVIVAADELVGGVDHDGPEQPLQIRERSDCVGHGLPRFKQLTVDRILRRLSGPWESGYILLYKFQSKNLYNFKEFLTECHLCAQTKHVFQKVIFKKKIEKMFSQKFPFPKKIQNFLRNGNFVPKIFLCVFSAPPQRSSRTWTWTDWTKRAWPPSLKSWAKFQTWLQCHKTFYDCSFYDPACILPKVVL